MKFFVIGYAAYRSELLFKAFKILRRARGHLLREVVLLNTSLSFLILYDKIIEIETNTPILYNHIHDKLPVHYSASQYLKKISLCLCIQFARHKIFACYPAGSNIVNFKSLFRNNYYGKTDSDWLAPSKTSLFQRIRAPPWICNRRSPLRFLLHNIIFRNCQITWCNFTQFYQKE